MLTFGSKIAFWGNGGLFRINSKFGGDWRVINEQFIISSFFGDDIVIDFTNIAKVIYSKKIIYPYILIVLKKNYESQLNITYIINPEAVLPHFISHGIHCINTHRSILCGFSDKELEELI